MLSSLPPLFPHDPHTLWYPSLSSNPQQPPPPSSQHTPPHQPHPNNNNNHHPHQQQHQYPHPRPLRTPLTTLHTDETALLARKANIRRFGAGWLRPPGVLKTLQGMADERAEREEVEAARAREMEVEIVDGGFVTDAGEEGGGVSDGEGERERDLDDEIPEEEEEEEGGSYEHTDTDSSTEGGDEGSSEEEGDGDRAGPRMATFNTRTGEVVRTLGSGGGGSGTEVVLAPGFGGRRGALGGMAPGMGEN